MDSVLSAEIWDENSSWFLTTSKPDVLRADLIFPKVQGMPSTPSVLMWAHIETFCSEKVTERFWFSCHGSDSSFSVSHISVISHINPLPVIWDNPNVWVLIWFLLFQEVSPKGRQGLKLKNKCSIVLGQLQVTFTFRLRLENSSGLGKFSLVLRELFYSMCP